MLNRLCYFAYYHSVSGFERVVARRIRLCRQRLENHQNALAIADWLTSPFYILAWNVAYVHLGHMTNAENKQMDDYLDRMDDAGLPADEDIDARLVYEPARCLARRLPAERIAKFLDYLSAHKHAIAVKLYDYAHDPNFMNPDLPDVPPAPKRQPKQTASSQPKGHDPFNVNDDNKSDDLPF